MLEKMSAEPNDGDALVKPMSEELGFANNQEAIFINLYEWVSAHLLLQPDWTMLEIGVGPNGFTPFYASRVNQYIGLDVDDYTRSYTHIQNAQIHLYDGITFPLQDKSVDLVVSHSVFEHVSDVGRMISESNRVLRAGGYFYLTINPMYYSSWGSHGTLADNVTKLPPWEHLNPDSRIYITDCPPQMVQSGMKGC
jgi:SAM-dependent methyltransferase